MLNKRSSWFIPGVRNSILASPIDWPRLSGWRRLTATVYCEDMNRLTPRFLRTLLSWLLPAALLLAGQGVWAHGFTHDLAKIAGQHQNDARHDCCLPFQAAGDAACGALPVFQAVPLVTAASALLPAGSTTPTLPPYASRAPPLLS